MLIKGGRVVTPHGLVQADVLIEGEIIKEVGRIKAGDEVIDARGRLIFPGMVDVHVHLRDFRQKHKETITTGTSAAIAGGVTSVVEMPNTKPEITTREMLRKREELLRAKAKCDYFTMLGITTREEEHVFGKLYLDGTLGEVDYNLVEEAKCRILAIHAEDYKIIEENKRRFKEHWRIRSKEAEITAIKKISTITTNKKLHICHVSCAESLKYIEGSCEVTPHHLLLNRKHIEKFKSIAKTNPPLRTPQDNSALLKALKTGKIPVIASDHAPHTLDEKLSENPPSGVPNLEITLRILLTLAKRGMISYSDITRWYSYNPSRIFGFEDKGEIAPGRHADIVIVNPKREGFIQPEEFYSRAKYSPFEGFRYYGEVETVLLRGRVAYYDGEVERIRGKKIKCKFQI